MGETRTYEVGEPQDFMQNYLMTIYPDKDGTQVYRLWHDGELLFEGYMSTFDIREFPNRELTIKFTPKNSNDSNDSNE